MSASACLDCGGSECICALQRKLTAARDLLEQAWGVIANGNGGNWPEAAATWRTAAERWRDAWHAFEASFRRGGSR